MKNSTPLILCIMLSQLFTFWFFSCQTKEHKQDLGLTRGDTIAIIQTALEDPKLDSIFRLSFRGNELKLVSNDIVKSDYDLIFRGKHTLIVDYDSSLYHPSDNPTSARFFGVVNLFKRISKDKAKVVLVFHSIGVVADYSVDRIANEWQISKRVIGRF